MLKKNNIEEKTDNGLGLKKQRGVSTLENILLAVALLAGLVTMYPIVQQSIAGRIKETVDTFGHGRQFEPTGNQATNIVVNLNPANPCDGQANTTCTFNCTFHASTTDIAGCCKGACQRQQNPGACEGACQGSSANGDHYCFDNSATVGPCTGTGCVEIFRDSCYGPCYDQEFGNCWGS